MSQMIEENNRLSRGFDQVTKTNAAFAQLRRKIGPKQLAKRLYIIVVQTNDDCCGALSDLAKDEERELRERLTSPESEVGTLHSNNETAQAKVAALGRSELQ